MQHVSISLSKLFDSIIAIWNKNRLEKVRFLLTVGLIFYLLLAFYGVQFPYWIVPLIVISQCVATFYPGVMGSLIRPLLMRTMTVVEMYDRPTATEITTEYQYDAAWLFYDKTPVLREWTKANLKAPMGVLPQRKIDEKRRTYWFVNPNDAFTFKMRWS